MRNEFYSAHLNPARQGSNFISWPTSLCAVLQRKLAACFISAGCSTRSDCTPKANCRQIITTNLGKGFDEKCVKFLRVDYDELAARIKQGGTDEKILDWCFTVGRKPTADDIYVWNEFMRKRGWNDEVSEMVERRKADAGMADRSDVQTSFQFIDADEGRLPKCE